MKFIITIFLIFLIFSPSIAQEENKPKPEERKKHALGVAVGSTSAYGLSYRHYFNKFGVQGTFAPLKTENNAQMHAGLTFLYNLVESRTANFFVYQSNYFYWNRDKIVYYNPHSSNPDIEETNTTYHLNNGLGIGFEFIIVKVVSLNLMGGYGAYKNFETIGITGEAGLYYKF